MTAFSDEVDYVDTSYLLDTATLELGEERGDTIFEKGGTNWILKYSGFLTPSFTLSALLGESESRQTQSSLFDEFPVILDNRSPAVFQPLGSWISVSITSNVRVY